MSGSLLKVCIGVKLHKLASSKDIITFS